MWQTISAASLSLPVSFNTSATQWLMPTPCDLHFWRVSGSPPLQIISISSKGVAGSNSFLHSSLSILPSASSPEKRSAMSHADIFSAMFSPFIFSRSFSLVQVSPIAGGSASFSAEQTEGPVFGSGAESCSALTAGSELSFWGSLSAYSCVSILPSLFVSAAATIASAPGPHLDASAEHTASATCVTGIVVAKSVSVIACVFTAYWTAVVMLNSAPDAADCCNRRTFSPLSGCKYVSMRRR
mmetsp:Transcript_20057/g.50611  ORF Transcript_20057/g.50611 Transcript_20057/m.50611 type:complete len:241 (+) Transcript_20057:6641-7363(+)